ncbi:hypothetical protein BY458DRAFT_503651 [Sporodiniella umbellata]|nr:hypothetical protein BY458DRAFT_503651 [Sporodiniella umbellata]
MSITYQSPTKSWNEGEQGVLSYSSNSDHCHLKPPQEFTNEIQRKKNFQPTTQFSDQSLDLVSTTDLNQILSTNPTRLLLIDVRSETHYAKSHILSAIHITIPSILLKRPNYTLDKVTASLKDKESIGQFERWSSAACIVFYDHTSHDSGSASITASLLAKKFKQHRYHGTLAYLQGGFEEFQKAYPSQCKVNPANHNSPSDLLTAPQPTSVATPAHSPFFFFNNIRQNLELSHGPLQERFAIRVPSERSSLDKGVIQLSASPTHPPRYGLGGSSIDGHGNFVLPSWLKAMMETSGPRKLAESYEALERAEQERLGFVMRYHSSHHSTDFPLSIASSMEKGTLNRYNNIWPFEYSRVKLNDSQDDFINANYLQYAEAKDDAALFPASPLTTIEKDIVQSGLLSQDSLETMRHPEQLDKDRKYIATQGPLPTTFADFWKMIWDQKSNGIVMLTNEEELQKVCLYIYIEAPTYQDKTPLIRLPRSNAIVIGLPSNKTMARSRSVCFQKMPIRS